METIAAESHFGKVPEESDPQGQRVDGEPGVGGGDGRLVCNGAEFQSGEVESSRGDGGDATELGT